MNERPEVGATYRHFKGNTYKVLFIGHHTETAEELVIYQSLVDSKIWVRPLEMWNEMIRKTGYSGPRFTKIDEEVV